MDLLHGIEVQGAHNVAKKYRQWLSQIFRFELAKGNANTNPTTALDVVAAPKPETRHNPQQRPHERKKTRPARDTGDKDHQTGHGFRHPLSTELNSRAYNRDWIECQLTHGDHNEIRDTYNHAPYLEQHCQMIQEWADSADALYSETKRASA